MIVVLVIIILALIAAICCYIRGARKPSRDELVGRKSPKRMSTVNKKAYRGGSTIDVGSDKDEEEMPSDVRQMMFERHHSRPVLNLSNVQSGPIPLSRVTWTKSTQKSPRTLPSKTLPSSQKDAPRHTSSRRKGSVQTRPSASKDQPRQTSSAKIAPKEGEGAA